jgi:hypothetical protein
MVKKWFSLLIEEIKHSYSDVLLIFDPDNLSLIEYIQKDIPEDFIIYQYKSEIGLRQFLSKNDQTKKRYIIFRSSDKEYFPSSIESKAELFSWGLKTVFSGVDSGILKSFPPKFYQKIYDKSIADISLSPSDADTTMNLICTWLWGIKPQGIKIKEEIIHLLSNIFEDCDAIPIPIKDCLMVKSFNLPESAFSSSEEFNKWLISQFDEYNRAKSNGLKYDIDFDSNELVIIREKIHSTDYRTKLSVIKNNIESIRSMLNCDSIDWFEVAKKWGELSYLKDSSSENSNLYKDEYLGLDKEITGVFEGFIINHHQDQFHKNSMNTLVTIDRVLQYLRYRNGEKKVLFCFDGMGFQEWYCIRSYLNEHGIFNFKEDAIFAMLPTITSISRGALFNGEKDVGRHKLEDKGFAENVCRWDKISGKDVLCIINADFKWHEYYGDYKCLGIVVNIVDDTAHSIDNIDQRNKRLMQEILSIKLKETEIALIFRNFINAGYKIFITSDHGTIWCQGNDYSIDKYLVDSRSKRVLGYTEEVLAREFFQEKQNELHLYKIKGELGEKYFISPKGRSMFAKKKYTAISHGGVHIEEVIVPFIEVLT